MGFEDGLPSVHLEGSLIGQDGHLWITTHSGLAISSSPIIDNSADERVEFTTTWDGENYSRLNCSRRFVQARGVGRCHTQAEERVIFSVFPPNGGGSRNVKISRLRFHSLALDA